MLSLAYKEKEDSIESILEVIIWLYFSSVTLEASFNSSINSLFNRHDNRTSSYFCFKD